MSSPHLVRLPSLETRRCQRYCSLEWLAAESGVSVATLRRAEAGHAVRWSTAERIADALGYPVRTLERPLTWHVASGSQSRATLEYAAALRAGMEASDRAYRALVMANAAAKAHAREGDPATLRRLETLSAASADANARWRSLVCAGIASAATLPTSRMEWNERATREALELALRQWRLQGMPAGLNASATRAALSRLRGFDQGGPAPWA